MFKYIYISTVPPPVITINPQQLINTTVGGTVMFQCRATSHGHQHNLMYYWLRVDEDKVVIDGANSDTLVISNVRHDDDGAMYQCGATNENGTTLSTIGRINGNNISVTNVYCIDLEFFCLVESVTNIVSSALEVYTNREFKTCNIPST